MVQRVMKIMQRTKICVVVMVTTVLALSQFPNSEAENENPNGEKTAVFLSPRFEMDPGSVSNKIYDDIDFPKGHIALKSFNAEVVDEKGNPVPLHETYLHHWTVIRFYLRKRDGIRILVENSGICGKITGQYFGMGSETRGASTHVPDPYGIVVGNPAEVPEGYEDSWSLNIHAIDTRGVENRLGCTECKCDLYNITIMEDGEPLNPNYIGGFKCCYDETQCKLREGFKGVKKRGLYMKYTVKWVDWDQSIVPVRIYMIDITDLAGRGPNHRCQIEYDVESCSSESNEVCIDSKKVNIKMPEGGSVVYAVGHQHRGGVGIALYGQDGRVICSSLPTYGQGKEAGDEEGYIVGMSTCYPNPGPVNIYDGETLLLESNYSNDMSHTGVMGVFYLLIADEKSPDSNSFITTFVKKHEITAMSSGRIAIVVGVAIAIVVYRRRSEREDGYQSIAV